MNDWQKSRRFAVLVLCCLGTVAAQTVDWRFIHPDAKAFVGFRVHRIMRSQIADAFRAQMKTSEMPDLSAIPGMDLMNRIDEVLISSPGRPDGAPDDAQPPVLVRVSGEFEANQVESVFLKTGAKMQKYRQYRVFRQKRDGDMAASLIDPHTLLLGDAPSLFAALERLEWTDPPKNPLLAHASELQATYDAWALFGVAPSALTKGDFPHFAALDALRGVELGVSVIDGLTLRLGLDTGSPEDAARLQDQLKALLVLANNPKGSPELSNVVKNLHFELEESSVRLQLKVGKEQMTKALAEMQKHMAERRAQMAALPPRPAPVVITPVPQGPRVIRIEGLDDGPREIPYK